MIAGRFLRWHKARQRVAFIKARLNAGAVVTLATYTHAWHYRAKHAGMFKATKSGSYVQRGKNWVCIDGCAIGVSA
jgi:hypothetical protein